MPNPAIFQSTPSARRATNLDSFIRNASSISIHALREESDVLCFCQCAGHVCISIHALREESDRNSQRCSQRRHDFNPRPPRGERLGIHGVASISPIFQSTPSARRATETVKDAVKDGMISIHALREESDLASTVLLRFLPYFNPRPPRGERPTVSSTARGRYCISIHALREESDGREVIREEGDILFQSTPSARRATLSAENSDEAEIFQSTPSARRATPELRGPCGA